MSVESLLLIRCKESIEELNGVVSSQKQEIDRLERNSKKLMGEIDEKESSRLALLEEIARLRRQLVQEKLRHDTEVNQKDLQVVALKKSLGDAELAHRDLLSHSVSLEHENKMLKERMQQNQRIAREWEESIVGVNAQIRLSEQERRILNEDIIKEREAMNKQAELYKLQVAELKGECERMHARNLEQEVVLRSRTLELEKLNGHQAEHIRLLKETEEQQKTIRVLEDENLKSLKLVQEYKLTMLRQQEEVELLTRKLLGLQSQQPLRAPLHSSKQTHNIAYRSNRSDIERQHSSKRQRRSSKHAAPEQYPSQPASEAPSAPSSIKKKLEFEESATSKRGHSKSRLEKLNRLQSRIKTVMESLRS